MTFSYSQFSALRPREARRLDLGIISIDEMRSKDITSKLVLFDVLTGSGSQDLLVQSDVVRQVPKTQSLIWRLELFRCEHLFASKDMADVIRCSCARLDQSGSRLLTAECDKTVKIYREETACARASCQATLVRSCLDC